MKKKFTVLSAGLTLIAIYAISFAGSCYSVFHSHDVTEPSCQCHHCQHHVDVDGTYVTAPPANPANSSDSCHICSMTGAFLDFHDLETTVEHDEYVPSDCTFQNDFQASLTDATLSPIVYRTDPDLGSPHLRIIALVVFRC